MDPWGELRTDPNGDLMILIGKGPILNQIDHFWIQFESIKARFLLDERFNGSTIEVLRLIKDL